MTALSIRGVQVHKALLGPEAQRRLLSEVRAVLSQAPLVRPVTPGGKPMSVRMSAAGSLGWISDRRGYRYEPRHPDGADWPPIPPTALDIWRRVSGCTREPECCLINHYAADARMGMHQDRDEADLSCPVISISLGDDGLFRIGNLTRGGRTESLWLQSGDVAVMGGEARLIYHGLDRLRPGSSRLLAEGGRFNLTLRVVTVPDQSGAMEQQPA